MSATNSSDRIWSARANPVSPVNHLAERVRHYLDQHPEVSRQEFFLEALRREIHFREQKESVDDLRRTYQESQAAYRRFNIRRRVTAEDIRVHAWLNERLAVLDYERHGLWPRVRRFLSANQLVRWLANS
jgi:hypothetical protein